MTELVPANDATLATIDQKIHYSQTISASNLLPEAYRGRPENVLIAVETGAALGIPAIQALNSINVIKGKAAMSADLMASLADMEEHLAPHVKGIDYGVPGQGDATELDPAFYEYPLETVGRHMRAPDMAQADDTPLAAEDTPKTTPADLLRANRKEQK